MFFLLLMGVGAAAGWLAHRHMDLPLNQTMSIAAGALGALVGGLLLQAVFSLLFGVIGALVGAAAVIWIAASLQRSRR
ncbi:MAG: GlsB/YeaQ/YmgE family stress response membrane protein [Pseudomonadota bacterium]